jgi:fucose permease
MDRVPRSRVWFAGFLLLGVLLGLIGPMLVAWRYHLDADPRDIGLHFLALIAGYIAAVLICRRLRRPPIRTLAIVASGIAAADLIGLAFAAPPAPAAWRLAGLGVLGMAAGALATSLLHSLDGYFEEPAGMNLNLTSLWFGSGCFLATVIVGASYSSGHDALATVLLGCVPSVFLVLFACDRSTGHNASKHRDAPEARNVRIVATVLFSLLLFFQFGNEWALAGWLPLFLIRRLGSNPAAAIFALAVYFFCLVAGRWVAQAVLPVLSHRKMLLASIVLAMSGYLLLATATTFSGAYTAIVIVGLGFGPIYPLVAENLGNRFAYRPGFYNGVFSIAITGAMAAPWLLGYVCQYFGMQYVMLVPAAGSVAVCLLALLIMLEAHLMREGTPSGDGELLY